LRRISSPVMRQSCPPPMIPMVAMVGEYGE
jgi:hypothetical protein